MLNRAVAIVAVLALFAGCENEHAVLRNPLAPQGRRHRAVAHRLAGAQSQFRRSEQPLVDAELARLAKLYAERTTGDSDIRQTYRGTFLEENCRPTSVVGERLKSPARRWETCYAYLERFRGDTDIDAQLYDRRAAVDRLCDLVVAWFDEQLVGKPEQAA